MGDGISLKAQAGRVYALCIAHNESNDTLATWIVDNDTGEVVSGVEPSFAIEYGAAHSPLCPFF